MKHCLALFALLPATALAAADLDSLLVPIAQMRTASAPAAQIPATPAAIPVAQPVPAAKAQAVPVLQADVLAALADALVKKYSPEGDLRVDAAVPWKGSFAQDSGWTLEITRLPPQGLSPRMIVSFRILCGEKSQGDFSMQLSCALYRDVFVTGRRVERGETLSAGDFSVQQVDVLPASVNAVSSSVAIGEYRSRAILSDGQLLAWRDIELKPLVRKGQVVEAVASEGAMRVTVKAVALEDGRGGDIVSVRNLSTSKDIQARILDERTVQVYF
jgi:flagella basal body P-ring formation protein FlgA